METVVPDNRDETFVFGDENVNSMSTDVQLFSFLVLLKAYIPESYLLMSECQKILGPPDPIHGGPPFEKRMKAFIAFIDTSGPDNGRVCMNDPSCAQTILEELATFGISRSATVKKLMFSLCGDQPQPHTLRFIKELLIKRKLGVKGKERFSRLIDDIQDKENFYNALSVLRTASDKLRRYHIFPQTIARLYCTRRGSTLNRKAEEWAKKAIDRAPNNSYVADTLGQVYKNRLRTEAKQLKDILDMAKEAFKAFKDVEMKADKEEGLEMDTEGTINTSNTFNNRGHFGVIQVAKIASDKLKALRPYPFQEHRSFIQNLAMEVEKKFDFFEWYLTYSKPGMTSLEPNFFWRDVVLCYEDYTAKRAAESTSFPSLLDCLNHCLFTSKGRRAGFEEAEKTVSDLEAIQDDLKKTYEKNVGYVDAAERYILSNIILSNKVHNSPQLTPVKELQTIIYNFLGTEVGRRSSEFYLLVLLLFWPEEQPQVVQEEDDEEVEQQATEDDGSEDWEDEDRDEEQDTRGEPAQLSLDLMFHPDLQQQVTFMEKAFERAEYAKYLRGRYLLPLFFLGKGFGLSKWIHKSRLDAIVEEKVDAELGDEQGRNYKKKLRMINDMWVNGEVWQVPEIKDILLPVQVELSPSPTMPQEYEEHQVFVCAGRNKIMATTKVESGASGLFYLGFTIQGPVVLGCPYMSEQ